MKKILIAALLVSVSGIAQEKVDLTVVNKIKAEAFNNSQVMDHLFYLTDVYGPRMTGTPCESCRRRVDYEMAAVLRAAECSSGKVGAVRAELADDEVLGAHD